MELHLPWCCLIPGTCWSQQGGKMQIGNFLKFSEVNLLRERVRSASGQGNANTTETEMGAILLPLQERVVKQVELFNLCCLGYGATELNFVLCTSSVTRGTAVFS